MQSYFSQHQPASSHSHIINTSITLSKGRNQQIVQQSQGITALLTLNLEKVSQQLMAYGLNWKWYGEVPVDFILIMNSLFSISLFVFLLLEVL
jgi:hypothetical protein